MNRVQDNKQIYNPTQFITTLDSKLPDTPNEFEIKENQKEELIIKQLNSIKYKEKNEQICNLTTYYYIYKNLKLFTPR